MLGVDSAYEIGVWIVAGRGSGRVGLFAHTDCHGPTRLFVHCRTVAINRMDLTAVTSVMSAGRNSH